MNFSSDHFEAFDGEVQAIKNQLVNINDDSRGTKNDNMRLAKEPNDINKEFAFLPHSC